MISKFILFISCVFFLNCSGLDTEILNQTTSILSIFPKSTLTDEDIRFVDTTISVEIKFDRPVHEINSKKQIIAIAPLLSELNQTSHSINIDDLRYLMSNTSILNEVSETVRHILAESHLEFPRQTGPHVIGKTYFNIDNTTLTFTPDEPFIPSTTYIIVLSGLVDKDLWPTIPTISTFQTIPTPQVITNEKTANTHVSDDSQPMLILNEILMNPPKGTLGDFNHDGERSAYDDEFIEIINPSNNVISLKNIQIAIGSLNNIRHTFSEDDELQPHKCLLLFGGGTPPELIGSCKTLSANKNFRMSNKEGYVSILSNDTIIDDVSYSTESNQPQSYTRSPDITGDFDFHLNANSEIAASPGSSLLGKEFNFSE